MKAVCVKPKEVIQANDIPYEDAVRKCAKEIEVGPDHPVFVSLEMGCLAVHDGVICGLSVEHILGEEQ